MTDSLISGMINELMESERLSLSDFYPNCDSPIEETFAWHSVKYLAPEVISRDQVEVATCAGTFRLDFLIESGSRKIGIECDGRDYHEYSSDLVRDSIILGSSDIDAIYRFRGTDINFRMEDALLALSSFEENLFSERGVANLLQLSIRNRRVLKNREYIWSYNTDNLESSKSPGEIEDEVELDDEVRLRSLPVEIHYLSRSDHRIWEPLFKNALARNWSCVEQIAEKFKGDRELLA